MDPFEVRMQFLSLITRLNSSLASIQKVSSFAIKHGPKCADDLWDCLVEECESVSLNARINLLFFLDTLLDKQGSGGAGAGEGRPYVALVKRDLAKVVDLVVPQTREGVLNLMAADQVLRSWKTRRLLDADIIDTICQKLETRRSLLHASDEPEDSTAFASFSRNDILRRIEDDRERHKRLRERIWVLPVPTTLFPTASTSSSIRSGSTSNRTSPESPASPSDPSTSNFAPSSRLIVPSHKPSLSNSSSLGNLANPALGSTAAKGRGVELAIEIEFDQLFEAAEEEERRLRAGTAREGAMEIDGAYPLREDERMTMRRETARAFHSVDVI